MKTHPRKVILTIVIAQMTLSAAPAQDANAPINALLQRLAELEQKVKILEHKHELEQEMTEAKAKTDAVVSIGAEGFVLRSADTNFVLKVKGHLQVDSHTFIKDIANNNTLVLRRARPIIEGTAFNQFDFILVP